MKLTSPRAALRSSGSSLEDIFSKSFELPRDDLAELGQKLDTNRAYITISKKKRDLFIEFIRNHNN